MNIALAYRLGRTSFALPLSATLALWLLGPASAQAASGIFRDGVGARPMALGGADVGQAEGPLSSFAANPAGAGWLGAPTLDLGGAGVLPQGRFSNAVNNDVPLQGDDLYWADVALGLPLGHGPVGVVIGFFPEADLSARWRYVDAPGGADGHTSYGLQTYRSEILALRAGAAVGWALSPKLSVGAGVGLIYNENRLQSPYVFQTEPALKGAKSLLDLDTSGYGADGQVGLLFRPLTNLQFGLAYKTPSTRIHSQGTATGNAGVQLANLGLDGVSPDFRYDAQMVTQFPQVVSGGVLWQVHPRWRLLGQVDWIDWQRAFAGLPVHLSGGNNADINRLLGSSSLDDEMPLDWQDQWVGRAGIEFALLQHLALRAGYVYRLNPVPAATLTPLTAAISQNTLTSGFGYDFGRWRLDFAYQYDFPAQEHVETSSLLSGEYSHSSTQVSAHWLELTLSVRF